MVNTFDPFRKTPMPRTGLANLTLDYDQPADWKPLGGSPPLTYMPAQPIKAPGSSVWPQHSPTTAGGQQTATGFRVNVPSAYGKANSYYYNGHAIQGDQGQHIALPVAYNAAADTRKWEYNGTPQESTMRRAVRYAYDDVQQGRAQDFNAALMQRLTQFYNEAGGQGVGYTLPANTTQATQAGAWQPKGGPTQMDYQRQQGQGGDMAGMFPWDRGVEGDNSYMAMLKRALSPGAGAGQQAADWLTRQAPTGPAQTAIPRVAGATLPPMGTTQTAIPKVGAAAVPDLTGPTTATAIPRTAQTTVPGMAPAGGWVDDAGIELLLQDPQSAYAVLRRAQGKTGRDRSILAGERENRYGRALQALSTLGPDLDPATINATINQVAQQLSGGGGLGNMLEGAAQGAMGRLDFANMDDADSLRALRALQAAGLYDASPLGQTSTTGELDWLVEQMLANTAGGGEGYFGNVQGSDYWKRLQALIGG